MSAVQRVPQYSKSTDAEVLAAVDEMDNGYARFAQAAHGLAQKYGGPDANPIVRTFFRSNVVGIACKDRPTDGRWKKGPAGWGWAPWRTNPVAAEFDALTHEPPALPGFPGAVHSAYDADGRHRMSVPNPFLHDGAAWVGFSWQPERGDQDQGVGPQWVEVLASEFHAARESAEAARS